MFKAPIVRLLFIVALILPCGMALAEEAPKDAQVKKPAATSFIRVLRDDDKQPIALQTATVRYVAASDEGELIVDLIGVVHIGDKKYYRQLNKQFAQYDVLLYELVARPEDRVPRKDRRGDNPLSMLHKLMNVVLDLDSQMDHIDYTKQNFVHADLSPEEMAKAIRERGDDQMTLMLSVAADLLRQQNLQQLKQERQEADPDAEPAEEFQLTDVLELLTDPSGPVKLKRMFAEQFANEGDLAQGLGKTISQILIDDRNKAAMKIFQKEMAKGKKRIGIFYGAAHMPDFEKRLTSDFGLKRKTVTWQTAWNLQPPMQTSGLERLLKLLED
ncbi:MAG: hypothetical protein IH991_17255 [Planctomycetes bacterium]|nr:hypothetical protein [Planctomycetota bacterium]